MRAGAIVTAVVTPGVNPTCRQSLTARKSVKRFQRNKHKYFKKKKKKREPKKKKKNGRPLLQLLTVSNSFRVFLLAVIAKRLFF